MKKMAKENCVTYLQLMIKCIVRERENIFFILHMMQWQYKCCQMPMVSANMWALCNKLAQSENSYHSTIACGGSKSDVRKIKLCHCLLIIQHQLWRFIVNSFIWKWRVSSFSLPSTQLLQLSKVICRFFKKSIYMPTYTDLWVIKLTTKSSSRDNNTNKPYRIKSEWQSKILFASRRKCESSGTRRKA